nr:MAG TPA: hypothetical protein [Caudoviricetes sp.]
MWRSQRNFRTICCRQQKGRKSHVGVSNHGVLFFWVALLNNLNYAIQRYKTRLSNLFP